MTSVWTYRCRQPLFMDCATESNATRAKGTPVVLPDVFSPLSTLICTIAIMWRSQTTLARAYDGYLPRRDKTEMRAALLDVHTAPDDLTVGYRAPSQAVQVWFKLQEVGRYILGLAAESTYSALRLCSPTYESSLHLCRLCRSKNLDGEYKRRSEFLMLLSVRGSDLYVCVQNIA